MAGPGLYADDGDSARPTLAGEQLAAVTGPVPGAIVAIAYNDPDGAGGAGHAPSMADFAMPAPGAGAAWGPWEGGNG